MVQIEKFGSVKTSGRHIIRLKDNIDKKEFISKHRVKTVYDYKIINAFAVGSDFDKTTLDEISASVDVKSISEDPVMRLRAVQNPAPWGLARLSRVQPFPPGQQYGNNFEYEYDGLQAEAGAGVDIYIVDSGVLITHEEFIGPDGNSRARWGATFSTLLDPVNEDDNGHGTHCAGIAAGNRYGVAKAANIIAVKTFNEQIGYPLDTIAGLDYIYNAIVTVPENQERRPSVVSMSCDGENFPDLVAAITTLTGEDVHVVVAAGDGRINFPGDGVGRNVENVSPANAPTAITVGYTDIHDNMVVDCNFGPGVDIFAPGVNITSSWIGANNATNTIGGTSMATPHVAGLVAYRINRHGNVDPNIMRNNLRNAGLPVVNNTPPGTTNILAHHG